MSFVFVRVLFPMKEQVEKITIRTDCKHEMVEELLSDYIQDVHMFKGSDDSPATDHDVYDIRFALCLGHKPKDERYKIVDNPDIGARWAVWSNCGNRALECGILLSVLKAVHDGSIFAFADLTEEDIVLPEGVA